MARHWNIITDYGIVLPYLNKKHIHIIVISYTVIHLLISCRYLYYTNVAQSYLVIHAHVYMIIDNSACPIICLIFDYPSTIISFKYSIKAYMYAHKHIKYKHSKFTMLYERFKCSLSNTRAYVIYLSLCGYMIRIIHVHCYVHVSYIINLFSTCIEIACMYEVQLGLFVHITIRVVRYMYAQSITWFILMSKAKNKLETLIIQKLMFFTKVISIIYIVTRISSKCLALYAQLYSYLIENIAVPHNCKILIAIYHDYYKNRPIKWLKPHKNYMFPSNLFFKKYNYAIKELCTSIHLNIISHRRRVYSDLLVILLLTRICYIYIDHYISNILHALILKYYLCYNVMNLKIVDTHTIIYIIFKRKLYLYVVSWTNISHSNTLKIYYSFVNYGYNAKKNNSSKKMWSRKGIVAGDYFGIEPYRTQSVGGSGERCFLVRRQNHNEIYSDFYIIIYFHIMPIGMQQKYYITLLKVIYKCTIYILQRRIKLFLKIKDLILLSVYTMKQMKIRVIYSTSLPLSGDYKLDCFDEYMNICSNNYAYSIITDITIICRVTYSPGYLLFKLILCYFAYLDYIWNKVSLYTPIHVLYVHIGLVILYCICDLGQITLGRGEYFDLALVII